LSVKPSKSALRPRRGHPAAAALLAALLALAGPPAAAAEPLLCGGAETEAVPAAPLPQELAAARAGLRLLLQQAQARSQALGAARLLAEAAQADLQEARATPLPRVTLGAGANALRQHQDLLARDGLQGQVQLSMSAPLHDGGRSQALVDWRARLLEAARLGEIDASEQVALQTVSLALEQQRYRRQAELYGRYATRMSCLVGALERIVAADRGRASELLQARNTLRQAELALAQTVSQQRQIETRLRRFVGETLPPPAPLEALLPGPPPLEPLLEQAARSSAIAQLSAQAEAQESYARAVRAGYKPQWSWSVAGSRTAGQGSVTAWSGGVSVSMPLVDLTAEPVQRAAQQRAEAARPQRDDALAARLQRVAEAHEQARAAFDRAQVSGEVLQGSRRLREATLQQWQQLGRRSLFDVISSESDYNNLQITRVNALVDAQEATALLWSLGTGVAAGLE
jgi:adhesin transport system outer membrane protein